MTRESLGTVRLHRWLCDMCGKETENKSKASGNIPMPNGWSAVKVQIDNLSSSADVCSAKCAKDYVNKALEPPEQNAVDPDDIPF